MTQPNHEDTLITVTSDPAKALDERCPNCRSCAVAKIAKPDAKLIDDGSVTWFGESRESRRGSWEKKARRCLYCLHLWEVG